jgi:hypothetical protein
MRPNHATVRRALIHLLYYSVGRSDDSRMMNLCDICRPAVLTCLGPCEAHCVLIVLRGGKAQKVREWCSC